MIDNRFRSYLEVWAKEIVQFFVKWRFDPNTLTWTGFFISLISSYFTIIDFSFLALMFWWIGRFFDGIDGIVARVSNRQSSYGGFLDINLDMFVYSSIAVAFLIKSDFKTLWAVVIMGYVLCITSALSLGEIERLSQRTLPDNRSLKLASGLAEAGETGIFYSLMWIFPQYEKSIVILWITVMIITVGSRFFKAHQLGKK